MKKYLTRAIKYFIFLMVIVALVIVLLILIGFADATNINSLFRNGYNAIWEIALIFLAVALIYPRIGFGNRNMTLRAKSWEDAKTNIMIVLGERSYKLESEDGNVFTFRKKMVMTRLSRYFEDRITIKRVSDDELVEGVDDQTISDIVKDMRDEEAEREYNRGLEERSAKNSGSEEGDGEMAQEQAVAGSGKTNKYVVNIEGLTKDVLRIVSGLYGIQHRNSEE